MGTVARLYVVYDADGSFVGEVAYLVGKYLLKKAHCAACDITHGTFSEKKEFAACKLRLGVPITQIHRDELYPELQAFIASQPRPNLATVVAEVKGDQREFVYVLGPKELDDFGGNVARFEEGLRRRLQDLDLKL